MRTSPEQSFVSQLMQRVRAGAGRWLSRSVGVPQPGNGRTAEPRHLQLTDLEQRIVYSATPVPVPAEATDVPCDVCEVAAAADDTAVAPAEATQRLELLFVDPSTPDADVLIQDVLAGRPDATFEVIVLDAERDGIAQISEALAAYEGVDAVHLVSHGYDGNVRIGGTWLNQQSLADYSQEFGRWSGSLAEDADFLIYGCDLAASEAGRDLVSSLSVLTGADVAASVDLTGNATLGGDWDLEFTVGTIETQVAFSAEAQQTWVAVLPNTPPTLAVTPTLNYTAGDPLTVIDPAASVADSDSPNFNGGTLTVRFTANATADDRLEIDTSGTLSLGGGGTLRWAPGGPPLTIGTWTGGTDGATPLQITFNANADLAKVESVVQSIGFRNVAAVPTDASRTVEFQLTDDTLATSNTQSVTVSMLGINSAPVNSVPASQSTAQDTPLVFSAANSNLISISDVDAGASSLEVTLTVTNGTASLNLPVNPAGATGPEFSLASNNSGIQREARVASLPDGRFVVVWSGDGPGDSDGIYMRQYNADLTPVAGQMRINSNGARSELQYQPDVAVNASGRIVVTWVSNNQDDVGAGNDGVYFRALNWDQSGDTGEIAANTNVSGDQRDPVAAIDAAGNVTLAWTDANGLDGHVDGVFARRFDAAGVPVDPTEWQVASSWGWKQHTPSIAMNGSGQFVITWIDSQADGHQDGVFAKRFSAAGVELDAPGTPGEAQFQVNTATFKDQTVPSVAIDDTGNFVVVWAADNKDGDGLGIVGQLFDSTGTRTGPTEFQVNTAVVWDQTNPSVSMDTNGDFVVAWEHKTAEFGPRDIRFQQFDSNAVAVGTEQTANGTIAGEQAAPDVAMDASGNFVVVWDGQTTTEGDAGAVARQYLQPPPPVAFSAGDGVGDSLIRFQGSVTDINAALDGLVFSPSGGFTGVAGIDVLTSDLGNSGVGGALSDNDSVTINVSATGNPVSVITDSDSASDLVLESASVGTTVGLTAFASDADVGDTVTYSLDVDAGGLFTIDSVSGVVRVAGALDAETSTSHGITVRATSSDGSSSTAGFTIGVSDVNDTAPVVRPGQTFGISELAANGSVVGSVSATDADTVGSLTGWVIVGGDPAGMFSIDSASGMLRVADNSTLDFESAASHVLRVRVSDGVQLSASRDVTVIVADANEAPVVTDTAFSVSENAADGAVLGIVPHADVDAGIFGNMSLAIVGGNADGAFSIDAGTGRLSVADAARLDFETAPARTIFVTATDGGGLSHTGRVVVNVLDANDAPQVAAPLAMSVAETDPAQALNLLLGASDADGDALAIIGASVISGDDVGIRVVGNSLLIDPGAYPHLSAGSSEVITLQYRVSDGVGQVPQQATVTITGVNTAPVGAGDTYTVTSGTPLVLTGSGVLANDADADSGTLTAAVTSLPTHGTLTLNPDGTLVYSADSGFAGTDTFTYQPSDGIDAGTPVVVSLDVTAASTTTTTTTTPTTTTTTTTPPTTTGSTVTTIPTIIGSDPAASAGLPSVDPKAGKTAPSDHSDHSDSDAPTPDLYVPPVAPSVLAAGPGVPTGTPADAELQTSDDDDDDEPMLFIPPEYTHESSQLQGIELPEDVWRELERNYGSTESAGSSSRARSLDGVIAAPQADASLMSAEYTARLEHALDDVDRELAGVGQTYEVMVQAASIGIGGLSIGYVLWMVRSGTLFASMLSSLPAWKMVDPLPILDMLDKRDEDTESLESLMDRNRQLVAERE